MDTITGTVRIWWILTDGTSFFGTYEEAEQAEGEN